MTRSTLDTGMCESLPDETAPGDCRNCGMSAHDCAESTKPPRNALACCPECKHTRAPIDVEWRLG